MLAVYHRSPHEMEVGYYLLRTLNLPHAAAARVLQSYPGEFDIILAGNGTRSRLSMIAIDRFIDVRRALHLSVGKTACIRWLKSPNRQLNSQTPIRHMERDLSAMKLVLHLALESHPMTEILGPAETKGGTAMPC